MGEQMSQGTEGLEAYWIMLPRNLVYYEILSLSLKFIFSTNEQNKYSL